MTEIGDIVEGYGIGSKKMIQILVESVCPTGGSVSGKVILKNRATQRTDKITNSVSWDVMFQTYRQPGWWPVDIKLKSSGSLSGRIKLMEVGEVIDIHKFDRNVDTCRNISARIAVNEGRTYTVNRTETGCTITRKA